MRRKRSKYPSHFDVTQGHIALSRVCDSVVVVVARRRGAGIERFVDIRRQSIFVLDAPSSQLVILSSS